MKNDIDFLLHLPLKKLMLIKRTSIPRKENIMWIIPLKGNFLVPKFTSESERAYQPIIDEKRELL